MRQMDNFKPWELRWEEEHIQRFWNWWGSNPEKSRFYFSRLVGDAILDEIGHYVQLTGTVFDLGAGPGYFTEKLLQRKIGTMAIDSSMASVNLLNERFNGIEKFLGAKVSSIEKMTADDRTADAAFLIETIEHLEARILPSVLSEVHRVLKPAGILIITTPNQENLAENQIMCPNCGCVFHTVQHLRSLSSNSLRELMEVAGFKTIVSKPTLFSWHPRLIRPIHRLFHRLRRPHLPHLLYIGRK